MTPPKCAMAILSTGYALSSVVDRFGDRALNHSKLDGDVRTRLRERVRQRCEYLLDDWTVVVQDQKRVGASLQYNPHERGTGPALLQDFLDPALKALPAGNWKMKFRANR